MDKINQKLIKIIENVFNKKISKIDNLKLNSFEEWDSVNHFYILLEIEKVFSIKFSEEEFFELNTIKLIKKKISQKLK